MGQKSRIMGIMILALGIGIVTSVSTVFAVESDENPSNPFQMIFSFFQELKYGLIPDGRVIESTKKRHIKFKPTKDFTLYEARESFNFWIFNLTLSLQGLYITALTFNIVDIFTNFRSKKAKMQRDLKVCLTCLFNFFLFINALIL